MEKYKLINSVTKIETICDKVTIDGFDYYVSNEIEDRSGKIAYINNDVYKNQLRIVTTAFGNENLKDCKKVITTNNPNIDIPKVVDEVEKFALEYENSFLCGAVGTESTDFVEGYNKSQETHPFSEEDIIEFAEWRRDFEFTEEFSRYEKEELLQLWKEQKPKTIYYE